MERIVADSGVAKRTLYRWWPTKAAVVADAILGGFVDVPANPIDHTSDVWDDIVEWLSAVSAAIRGPYGEVLRASTAISATAPELGAQMADAFASPAETDLRARLDTGVRDGQISRAADLDATIALLMAIIVYAGTTREGPERLTDIVAVIRSGISG